MTATKKRKRSLKVRLDRIVEDMVGRGIRLTEAQQQLERAFLDRVMRQCDGNQSRAADVLEVHRNTLRRKLREHGLI
jgi:DNA-binding protein Fis